MATVMDTQLMRALRVTPNASQTRSKAPGNVGPRFGPGDATDFPLFSVRGEGAYVFDDRGRKYLDCFGANAAVPLGHAFPAVVEAVTQAVRDGNLLSLPSVREAAVSELFLETCAPWAHQVRWVKTGSEAVHAAVIIARAASNGGRSLVVVADSAYHGWHSWFQASYTGDNPGERTSPSMWDRGAWCADDSWLTGVPVSYGFGIVTYRYGDMASLEQASAFAGTSGLKRSDERRHVAAVLVEPARWERTDVAWLRQVRDWCTRNGAVLIFDEMVYGLRWAKGGAAEHYGVTPDLACFGKALGNGVPVACVCGPSHLMQHATLVSGTYGGDVLGLAAADAVLHAYRERDVIGELRTRGLALRDGFSRHAPPEATLEGTPQHWRLAMPDDEALDRVLLAAAREGVLVHRASNSMMAAMTADEARHAGEVIGRAATEALR
jgi:glutamate-1-semialdehyde 2,1-aminomutase